MKKNYFLGVLLFVSSLGYSQKTIIVNGGQFSNPNENVNVQIYDPILNSSKIIDTINTASVQEILFDGNIAYVAAQDSLVAYDLSTETRVAATRFKGLSTKSLEIIGNEILVGNFYGQTSNNLYIYNKSNLNLIDSIPTLTKAVKSIIVHNARAYIPQNSATPNFTDTLGNIVVLDVPNRTIIDTISIPGYTGDVGQIIAKTDGSGFITVNSGSNTISQVPYSNISSATNTSMAFNLDVGGRSQYAIHRDTLFLKAGAGISAININTAAVVETDIVDTVITGFTYDTISSNFYVTQTNFFSYQLGKEYDRNGNKTKDFTVGFSPEVIRVYYGTTLSISDIINTPELKVNAYPNPSNGFVQFDLQSLELKNADLLLIDASGKQVLRKDISLYDNSIDISGQDKGVYFALLRSENTVYKTRLVKY